MGIGNHQDHSAALHSPFCNPLPLNHLSPSFSLPSLWPGACSSTSNNNTTGTSKTGSYPASPERNNKTGHPAVMKTIMGPTKHREQHEQHEKE
jgi:hypothetical protein